MIDNAYCPAILETSATTIRRNAAPTEPLIAWISRRALADNLAAFRRRVGPGVGVCAMIKADGYGHGQQLVASELAAAGVEFLAVARLEEAVAIRRLGIDRPILLCEPAVDPNGDSFFADRLAAICRVDGLRVTVADAAAAAALARTAARLDRRVAVHLKIDTGMGRVGALPDDADAVARVIESATHLTLEGLYTHLATADEPGDAFAREQFDAFFALVEAWAARGRRPRWVHAANSAAALRFPHPRLTLARPGIVLYGYPPGPGMPADCPLSPILRLTGRIIFVKDLPPGHPVGYGCTWRSDRPTRLGLVPIGYGDGYKRAFGNRAMMQVGGRDVPVVGRISMDLTTIDLTDLPDGGRGVRAGATVTVISEHAADANSVEKLARLADTIPYEITTSLGTRVRRVLVDDFPPNA
ncbi:MAG: Alanine racemase 1 [Phycisphaerae bacterium]|nr:Alanine racemase 1 [Phycisphaerae bacterium]